MAKQTKKLIANNKKAYHDYFIEDKYEAGISLAGTEVKSLRMGRCSVKEAFIRIEKGEVYVYNKHLIIDYSPLIKNLAKPAGSQYYNTEKNENV